MAMGRRFKSPTVLTWLDLRLANGAWKTPQRPIKPVTEAPDSNLRARFTCFRSQPCRATVLRQAGCNLTLLPESQIPNTAYLKHDHKLFFPSHRCSELLSVSISTIAHRAHARVPCRGPVLEFISAAIAENLNCSPPCSDHSASVSLSKIPQLHVSQLLDDILWPHLGRCLSILIPWSSRS